MMADDVRARFHDLLSGFSNGMLITRASEGDLRARPMAVADVDTSCNMWFVTTADSGKVEEITADPMVCLTFQAESQFLSLTGNASVIEDRAKLRTVWRERWRIWFPQGAEDPDVVLLRVAAEVGEFWDGRGLNRVRYLFAAGRAYLSGRAMQRDARQNQKVRL
jgi:general stress protein 26